MHSFLSIDLGLKHLGYAIIRYDKEGIKRFEDLTLSFGLLDISRCKTVESRCCVINQFISSERWDCVIVERQVHSNIRMMELMYSCVMCCVCLHINVQLFDPKMKFTHKNVEYTTRNKQHKKLSINMFSEILNLYYSSELLQRFNSETKKDDIADAANQAITYLFNIHELID